MTLLKPEQQNLNNQGPFYAMTVDPKASTVELVRHDVVLRIVPKTALEAGPDRAGLELSLPGRVCRARSSACGSRPRRR